MRVECVFCSKETVATEGCCWCEHKGYVIIAQGNFWEEKEDYDKWVASWQRDISDAKEKAYENIRTIINHNKQTP